MDANTFAPMPLRPDCPVGPIPHNPHAIYTDALHLCGGIIGGCEDPEA